MSELYEDICGNHSGGRTLAYQTHSQGYYWPTMKKYTKVYATKCDKCQRYAPVPHMPAKTLNLVTSPLPFTQWGMDIVRPLPITAAQKKFLLVATDYFSKWVEAEAYASIKDKDVTKFIWKNIACRFGIPQTIIADNGPQFDNSTFKTFCSELNIKNLYYTPRYPQSNGQTEATNKTLLSALKKRLEKNQRQVGQRVARRLVGLSDHAQTTNKEYPVRPRIRSRCSHPNGNWLAYSPNSHPGSEK
ncbi:Pol polyprotein [Vitis vinifera]|uniref:Pol polyprotein n=1 Tax=Vitis vinifera TaxID=29760 RepID=A0A438IA63_VITVI|nr:Pol polyprotein [Vitis vinifera]